MEQNNSHQTYLKDCSCKTDAVIVLDGEVFCRQCILPYSDGGIMFYDVKQKESDMFIWREVPNMGGLYLANKAGMVFSVLKNKIIKGSPDSEGYIQISVLINGVSTKRKIHRLVALACIPNPENKPQVNHNDFNRSNNAAYNLTWATSKEDAEHKVFHNRQAKGQSFKSRKGGNGSMAKLVLDIQTGIFYDCLVDAAFAKNIPYKKMSPMLTGKVKNISYCVYV